MTIRSLYDKLSAFNDFKDFFIEVSKMKLSMDVKELKLLRTVVDVFSYKFGTEAIVYLTDSIDFEIVFSKHTSERKLNEEKMKEEVISNFNLIFPYYKFISCEKQVDGVGKIDIYALYGERSVIIELKTGNKNPNTQLIAYGSQFENPILIGITEKEINSKKKIDGIFYFTMSELRNKLLKN